MEHTHPEDCNSKYKNCKCDIADHITSETELKTKSGSMELEHTPSIKTKMPEITVEKYTEIVADIKKPTTAKNPAKDDIHHKKKPKFPIQEILKFGSLVLEKYMTRTKNDTAVVKVEEVKVEKVGSTARTPTVKTTQAVKVTSARTTKAKVEITTKSAVAKTLKPKIIDFNPMYIPVDSEESPAIQKSVLKNSTLQEITSNRRKTKKGPPLVLFPNNIEDDMEMSFSENHPQIVPYPEQTFEKVPISRSQSGNYINVDNTQKEILESPLVNGGIPIRPGEIITANSDLIVGRPKLGLNNHIKPNLLKPHKQPFNQNQKLKDRNRHTINSGDSITQEDIKKEFYAVHTGSETYDLRPPKYIDIPPKITSEVYFAKEQPKYEDRYTYKSTPNLPPVYNNILHTISNDNPTQNIVVSSQISSDAHPLLVDVQPSKVANVVIPKESDRDVIVETHLGHDGYHSKGISHDMPLPYEDSGYFSTFNIETPNKVHAIVDNSTNDEVLILKSENLVPDLHLAESSVKFGPPAPVSTQQISMHFGQHVRFPNGQRLRDQWRDQQRPNYPPQQKPNKKQDFIDREYEKELSVPPVPYRQPKPSSYQKHNRPIPIPRPLTPQIIPVSNFENNWNTIESSTRINVPIPKETNEQTESYPFFNAFGEGIRPSTQNDYIPVNDIPIQSERPFTPKYTSYKPNIKIESTTHKIIPLNEPSDTVMPAIKIENLGVPPSKFDHYSNLRPILPPKKTTKQPSNQLKESIYLNLNSNPKPFSLPIPFVQQNPKPFVIDQDENANSQMEEVFEYMIPPPLPSTTTETTTTLRTTTMKATTTTTSQQPIIIYKNPESDNLFTQNEIAQFNAESNYGSQTEAPFDENILKKPNTITNEVKIDNLHEFEESNAIVTPEYGDRVHVNYNPKTPPRPFEISQTRNPEESVRKPDVTRNPDYYSEFKPDVARKPEIKSKPEYRPEVTRKPEYTRKPEVTRTPEYTRRPEVTRTPEYTHRPEVTRTPEYTHRPEVTREPEYTRRPEVTRKPEITRKPEYIPEITSQPDYRPEITRKPEYRPEITRKPEYRPETTSKLDYRPEITRKPEYTPEITRKPEFKPDITNKPEFRPEVTSKPEFKNNYIPDFARKPQNKPDFDFNQYQQQEIQKISTHRPVKYVVTRKRPLYSTTEPSNTTRNLPDAILPTLSTELTPPEPETDNPVIVDDYMNIMGMTPPPLEQELAATFEEEKLLESNAHQNRPMPVTDEAEDSIVEASQKMRNITFVDMEPPPLTEETDYVIFPSATQSTPWLTPSTIVFPDKIKKEPTVDATKIVTINRRPVKETATRLQELLTKKKVEIRPTKTLKIPEIKSTNIKPNLNIAPEIEPTIYSFQQSTEVKKATETLTTTKTLKTEITKPVTITKTIELKPKQTIIEKPQGFSTKFVTLTHTTTVTHTKLGTISSSTTKTIILTEISTIYDITTEIVPTTLKETVTRHIPIISTVSVSPIPVPIPTTEKNRYENVIPKVDIKVVGNGQTIEVLTKQPSTTFKPRTQNKPLDDISMSEDSQEHDLSEPVPKDGDDSILIVLNKSQTGQKVEPYPPEEPEVTIGEESANGVAHVLLGEILMANTPFVEANQDSGKIGKTCIPECRPTRNELCQRQEGAMRCVCRPGFARTFPDRPCKPTYTYSVKMGLKVPMKRTSSTNVENAAKIMVMRSDLRDVLHAVNVANINTRTMENDGVSSMDAELRLQLSENPTFDRIYQSIEKSLKSTNFSLGGTDISVNNSFPNKMFAVEDYDECKSPQFRDCSDNAECFNLRGTYTCSCLEGYTDISENKLYAGRICSADGGCAACNYHGACYTRDTGGLVCECFNWYTGNTCNINLKVVLISISTLGAILLILLALCIAMSCCRPSKPKEKKNKIKRNVAMSVAPSCIQSQSDNTRWRTPGPGDRKSLINQAASEAVESDRDSLRNTSLPYIHTRKFSQNTHEPFCEVSGSVTSHDDLKLMIPRAKYRPADPQSPLMMQERKQSRARKASKVSKETRESKESKLIEYLEGGNDTNITKPRKPSTDSAAILVSAGSSVSAILNSHVPEMKETTGNLSEILEGNSDYGTDYKYYKSFQDGIDWSDAERRIGELTMSEARSFDGTLIRPSTKLKTINTRSHHGSNKEAHTMAERDLGSTYLLPRSNQLYKPDGSDVSEFDSL